MEDDNGAVFRRQPSEGVLERGTIGDGVCRIRIEVGGDQGAESCVPAARATRLCVAGIDDEAMEPGVEASRLAEGRQVAPRADQGLLGRVLGAMGIAKDAIREGVAAVDVGRSEGRERVWSPVAARTTSWYCSIGPTIGATRLVASPSMEPVRRETFSPPRLRRA